MGDTDGVKERERGIFNRIRVWGILQKKETAFFLDFSIQHIKKLQALEEFG